MNGRTVTERLEALCRDLDLGRPLSRIEWGVRALAPVAVGLAMGVAAWGCGTEAVDVYGAPPAPQVEQVCTGGFDEDHDGLADCMDPDCAADSACAAVEMYGAPMPTQAERDCGNGADDDRDGVADCMDPDCAGASLCNAVTAYGAPAMPAMEQACADGADDDRDGLTDCADPDCAAQCAPSPGRRYGAPFQM